LLLLRGQVHLLRLPIPAVEPAGVGRRLGADRSLLEAVAVIAMSGRDGDPWLLAPLPVWTH